MRALELAERARALCREEYEAHVVYSVLAKSPLLPRRVRELMERASGDELRHYEFWRGLSGECASPVSRMRTALYALVLSLFGATAVLKLLESGEREALATYRELLGSGAPEELERIIEDEEEHEARLVESTEEGRVRYLSSIALGVSDALIELTGIYAGALGAFESARSVGLVGLVAGLSASISMGAASYSQARHSGLADPRRSALYTMAAYLSVALLLALPYFSLRAVSAAFAIMIALDLAVVAYMSFYSSVLHGRRFARELSWNAALLLGVSLALYVVGSALRSLVGTLAH